MQQLLDKDHSALVSFKAGESIKGEVLDVNDSRVLMELASGMTGIITRREAAGYGTEGDEIEVRERTSSRQLATRSMEESQARTVPEWLTLNADALKATVNRLPNNEETESGINVQLVVEFYSR